MAQFVKQNSSAILAFWILPPKSQTMTSYIRIRFTCVEHFSAPATKKFLSIQENLPRLLPLTVLALSHFKYLILL